MNFNDLPPDTGKHIAPAAGALTALFFFKGETWKSYAGALVAGYLLAKYATPLVISVFPRLDGETAGYFAGLCGFVVVKKLFETWTQFDAGTLLKEKARRVLGLDKPQ